MKILAQGSLDKMIVRHESLVQYELPLGTAVVALNPLMGKTIRLEYNGKITCVHCGKQTSKSFNQGYCYPCFRKLAACDICIMSPEKCHYHHGTCREPEWARQYCMTDHVVYLANTSGPKVGITRASQIPTRWIDQGAVQALPVMRVKTRYQAGLVEDIFRQRVADKTGWQAMLKGSPPPVDLLALKQQLLSALNTELQDVYDRIGSDAFCIDKQINPMDIVYPVMTYPQKIKSLDFDKQPVIEGCLLGIKGQYLLLDTGVLNIRKFTAYSASIAQL